MLQVKQPQYPAGRLADRIARKASLRFRFDTEGMAAVVSISNGHDKTRLGLTVALQTFLTALTWICSANNAPVSGWLTVTLGKQRTRYRVEKDLGDSSFPKLIRVMGETPSILRGALRSLENRAGV